MRILFTGSSSFTGAWFVRELAGDGHEVVATCQGTEDSYEGVRGERVALVRDACDRVEFGCSFGDDRFLAVAADGRYDALCHHAAFVTDYKSPDFDFARALTRNTHNLRPVLDTLAAGGCRRVVATGSVFENDEGAGDEPLRAFSPYGLSKGLTWLAVRHFAQTAGLSLGKFVIANPFGPYEEPRFTAYLVRTWARGETPRVATPAYLRDNIHVSLLALAYADFVAQLPEQAGVRRFGPCGYVETQGAFAQRFAEQMRPRLGLSCDLELGTQTEFPEPVMRTNKDIVLADQYGWDEVAAWDELGAYYRRQLAGGA